MKKCPHCGAKIEKDDTFCGGCGQPVTAAPAKAKPSASPEPPRKKRKVWLIVLIVVLAAGILGTGGFLAYKYLLPGGGTGETSVKQFVRAMDDLCKSGDELAEQGLSLQSESYYAFAGCSVSSLRYAVEYILWLKGEGETLEALAADSRYAGWDKIAAVCYASPYPYYFEGLIYHVQDKKDEAKEAYANTLLNPAYPEDGVDFYYLKNKEVKDLYALRDELREKETAIYGKYTPNPVTVGRDPYLFDTSYLRAKSEEAVAAEDYASAAVYGKIAVQNDPLDVLNFKNAALCCLYADEGEKAAEYLDAGLVLAPEDEGLKTLYTVFSQLGGDGQ